MAEPTHRTLTRIVTAALGLLFAAILPPRLAAQSPSQGFPSMIPDPMASDFARRGAAGDYSWEDLAEIALWASAVGATPAVTALNTAAYMTALRQAVAELRASGEMQGAAHDPAAAGDHILTYMHRKFLKSYSTLQTRLDTLLGNGRYNCVSSAALYLILARSQGLAVQGVITRDHAFVTVYRGDASWDVETTNAYGFDPGNRREFHDQFGKATGFAYVPAGNYRDRTSVSPLELVSLILSNRIAELESRGRYTEAVPLALNRAALLAGRSNPTAGGFFTDPQKDLRDRVLHYGASLLNAGKEEEGLRWAAYAETAFLQADGQSDPRWQEYINTLVSNRIAKLCNASRFGEARSFLTENQTRIDPAKYRSLEILVTDGEIVTLANNIKQAGDAVAVFARIDRAEAAGLLPAARARELRNNISRWRIADYHNRFATAFNRRDYSLARSILEEALAEFPGDRQLSADRTTLNRATGG